MKYIIGSLIISFGILIVAIIVLNSMQIKAPENSMSYIGLAWLVIAVVVYPFSKKIIRSD